MFIEFYDKNRCENGYLGFHFVSSFNSFQNISTLFPDRWLYTCYGRMVSKISSVVVLEVCIIWQNHRRMGCENVLLYGEIQGVYQVVYTSYMDKISDTVMREPHGSFQNVNKEKYMENLIREKVVSKIGS